MTPEQIKHLIGRLSNKELRQARVFYDLITHHRLRSVLQVAYVQSFLSASIAGAVEDVGGGKVTCLELRHAKQATPDPKQLLDACGLSQLVQIREAAKLVPWLLSELLESTGASFDLVYINNLRTWNECALAVSLGRDLLRPGGWLVLGNMQYTLRTSDDREKAWVLQLPEEEQSTSQAERAFRLLIMKDARFDTFRMQGALAFTHKKDRSTDGGTVSDIELQIALAAQRAYLEPEYRQRLIRFPAETLAAIAEREADTLSHVRFFENDLWSPSEPELNAHGLLTHALERPFWDKRISEEELIAMARD